jgi:hypothetical protein
LYFVFRSMSKHLRRVNEAARAEAARAEANAAKTDPAITGNAAPPAG